jgi:hypothetical protein
LKILGFRLLLCCGLGDIEELLEEISRRMDEDISWQLGDLFHRTGVMMSLLREKEWAKETLDREFGPNWGW